MQTDQKTDYREIIEMISTNKIPLLVVGGGVILVFGKFLVAASVLSLIGWLGGKVSRRLEERSAS